MKQIKSRVISNRILKPRFYRMSLDCRGLKTKALPGQFMNIRVTGCTGVLLRKPLSIYGAGSKPGALEVVYEVVGRGTEVLSRKSRGDELDILAPLGNGFRLPAEKKRAVLVGGGTGIASLHFLALTLRKAGFGDVHVLIGARDKDCVLCGKELVSMGCAVKVATDDGSRGFRGPVTDLLEKHIAGMKPAVYACGPKPMLKKVVDTSRKMRLSCQVSLEEYMGCGVGACMSCVVKTRGASRGSAKGFEYRRVCSDGPVFEGSEIIWE